MKIKLGVIFGGPSVEHEISIISAVQAMQSINQDKYDIIPIYITKDRQWYTGKMLMDIDIYNDFNELKRYAKQVILCNVNGTFYLQNAKGLFKRNIAELDIVFPIVHGSHVEDGTLAGYFEAVGIPYVGCGVLGAALGQDKVVMKQIFESMKLPIVDYTWCYDSEYLDNKEEVFSKVKKIGYPVIVKPANLGSSIGINVVKNEENLDEAILEAIKYDDKIVIEKVINNLVEVNCSVLGNYEFQQTSELEEVMSSDEFLTYADKYIGNGKGGKTKGMVATDRIIPARLDEKTKNKIKEISKMAFRALNLSGICRIDFLIDKKTKEVYINEPNTIPGSLSFYLWEPTGKPYFKLLDEAITIAIKDYKKNHKKTTTFETNVLSNFNGLKGSKGKLKFGKLKK